MGGKKKKSKPPARDSATAASSTTTVTDATVMDGGTHAAKAAAKPSRQTSFQARKRCKRRSFARIVEPRSHRQKRGAAQWWCGSGLPGPLAARDGSRRAGVCVELTQSVELKEENACGMRGVR